VTRFWHPLADMGLVDERGELIIERGEGARIWDDRGRSYIDAPAALWYCNVGYGRHEIGEAAAEQIRKIPSYSAYGDLATQPTVDLAERLAGLSPLDDARVFFTSGGAESIESAAKLARRYFSLIGQPERTVLISRERSYHGLAGYGTSLAGSDAFREGLTSLVPDIVHVEWDSADALREGIERVGAERVAAFFCEPVIGAGGVFAPQDEYFAEVREITREAGCLLVADEVITGFGRCGHWFASERWGLDPDLITFAKGSTSGYLPLGGVIVAGHVAEPFWQPGGGAMFRHGYTYSGHAAVAAASHANLDILEADGLLARGLELEGELTEALEPLADHPLVAEIRSGKGALAAVQLTEPGLADRAAMLARDHGVLTRVLAVGALQVSPPLVITRAEVDEMVEGLGAALDACRAGAATPA
jgi:adenosylmethionine-8-amino-7-oxononanoate aminotransferase